MDYQECIRWLFGQLPMYQRQGKAAYKANLDNTIAFANHLGNPEHKFKSVHVGGTNGKGSVSHMLASVFQESGFKVGLYTSPHLIDFRERIKINGELIPEQEVLQFVETHQDFMKEQQLSFFEMTVGMAFSYFAEQKVDIAIIEVGLGGRLDSTNIIIPELSIITNISLDHTAFLGNTLAKIAAEKAGIIKPNTPVIIGEFHPETFPVFEEKAEEVEAPFFLADQKKVYKEYAHLVKFQQKNLITLIESLMVLGKQFDISEEAIQQGIAKVSQNTGLLGRWQVLQQQPKVICDTGHNPAGISLIVEELAKESYSQLHLVIGMVNDKDVSSILKLLPKKATYYFCQPSIPRALSSEILYKEAQYLDLKGSCFSTVEMAYLSALQASKKDDLIFVGGSTFVVADLLVYLQKQ